MPIIDIKLNNTTIETINGGNKKEKYRSNKIKIIDKNIPLNDTITIKGRGNYTWNFPKKPYQIEFEKETSILGFKDSTTYVLLANYLDASLLKNDFTLRVAQKLNVKYTNIGAFIDLYIDKKYLGNYYVTPKIMISKSSVDLKNKNSILIELDNHYYQDEEYFESNIYKDHLVLKDIKGKREMYQDFQNKYNQIEEYIYNKDFDNLKEIVDLESLAKYYIIAEFSSNFDALQSSFYMYQDGENDMIHIGPIWDYDVAYGGKKEYSDVNKFYIKEGVVDSNATCIFYELLQIDEFDKLVKDVWKNQASNIYKKEIDYLDKQIQYINKSGTINNGLWNINSYNHSSSLLKHWLSERYKNFEIYMEKN